MDDSAASAAVPEAYDPAKDPLRKPKKVTDPAWKYGYWDVIGNRDCVVCTLCGKKGNGGINRHKKHLAGGWGDVLGCLKTTTEIKREMTAFLKAHQKSRPVLEEGDDEVVEEVSASSVRPSSGTGAKQTRRAYTFKVPAPNKSAAVKSVASMIRKRPDEVVDDRRSGSSQPSIVSGMKTLEDRHADDCY